MNTKQNNHSTQKSAKFKELEERIDKAHSQLDQTLALLETEKDKGNSLSKQLQQLTLQLEAERHRDSKYYDQLIQQELQHTLDTAVIEELNIQNQLNQITNIIGERKNMIDELTHLDAQMKPRPTEIKKSIQKCTDKELKLEAQKKKLKDKYDHYSKKLKDKNEKIENYNHNSEEWKKKVIGMVDLVPYINQYIDAEGNLKQSKQNDNTLLSKPFEVKKQHTNKASSQLLKEEDFWLNANPNKKYH